MSEKIDKKELGKRLDKLASLFARHNEKKCFTCGKRLAFRKRQAGHYVPRVVLVVRWHPENIHTQCAKCNVELDGNLAEYSKRLEPGVRQVLDHCKELYNIGKAPAISYGEMKTLYNFYLEYLKKMKVATPPEWHKL